MMKQKRQYNVSKVKSKAHYTKENIIKFSQACQTLRIKCEARGLVDSFDELMLYSEKIRRTMIRVRVRSNHLCKRAALKMMKEYI